MTPTLRTSLLSLLGLCAVAASGAPAEDKLWIFLTEAPDAAHADALRATGAEISVTSRWLDAVAVQATAAERRRIAALPFVDRIQPVLRLARTGSSEAAGIKSEADDVPQAEDFYGRSWRQIEQIRLDTLHREGFTGKGVTIAVLDTGFRRSHAAFQHPDHPLNVVAEWDFVDDDPSTGVEPGDPPRQHDHGTMVLAILAGYLPGEYVGAAYDASYVLAKVEDAEDEFELEEDWFVAGLEFAAENGAQVVSSSLVAKWYRDTKHDGVTSVMAQAVNAATARGIHVVQGVGNRGHDNVPATHHLGTPADAFEVISVGAVDDRGGIVRFSSDGPTVDGRRKPEVLAQGHRTVTVSPSDDSAYSTPNGTSVATPLVAGTVACLVQAHPGWSVAEMRSALMSTARHHAEKGGPDRLQVVGHGLVDAAAAHRAVLCSGREKLRLPSCQELKKGHELVAHSRGGQPFAVHTLRLDGDPATVREITLNAEGRGQTVFRRLEPGVHTVELLQCGDVRASVECR